MILCLPSWMSSAAHATCLREESTREGFLWCVIRTCVSSIILYNTWNRSQHESPWHLCPHCHVLQWGCIMAWPSDSQMWQQGWSSIIIPQWIKMSISAHCNIPCSVLWQLSHGLVHLQPFPPSRSSTIPSAPVSSVTPARFLAEALGHASRQHLPPLGDLPS